MTNGRARSYIRRDILIDRVIKDDGTAGDEVEAILDFKRLGFANCDITCRLTQAATHATTVGVAVSGVWGSVDEEGEQVFDSSSTPENFGTIEMETNQSEPSTGTLMIRPDISKGRLLKLIFSNTDVTNDGVLDVWATN